jgi:hypothetical protein
LLRVGRFHECVARSNAWRCTGSMQEEAPKGDGAGGVRAVRNPDWTRDETILLMDLYLSAPRAGKTHPQVIALSTLLRAAGRREGLAVLPTFRNPVGVAMRLRNFGRHDPDAPEGRDAGWRPGGAMDMAVWGEFGADRGALAAEVTRIRRSIVSNQWVAPARSSRGPSPSFGSRSTEAQDGPTGVYLLLVDGPLELLAPSKVAVAGWIIAKVGRTKDLERRMSELACGLPPSAAIRYLPVAFKLFGNGLDAHRFERRILDVCDHSGWSLGGEFVYAPLEGLKSEFVARNSSKDPRISI